MQIDAQLADRAEQRLLGVVGVRLQTLGYLFQPPAFDVLEHEGLRSIVVRRCIA
jgi:hypothetical protein